MVDRSLLTSAGVTEGSIERGVPLKKALKKQGDKSLVNWMEYPKSLNSWIDTKAIIR